MAARSRGGLPSSTFQIWIEDKTDGNADRSQKIESNA
jgi:hypothetical protein